MLNRKRTRENVALKMHFRCGVRLCLTGGGVTFPPIAARVPARGDLPPIGVSWVAEEAPCCGTPEPAGELSAPKPGICAGQLSVGPKNQEQQASQGGMLQ